MYKLRENNKGTTLVEVLTTIAILAIGILAVARMFAGGFGIIKRSEHITFASRLAERELERLRARSHTLPQGVALLTGAAMPALKEVNKADLRQIIGETVKIPGPSLSGGVSGTVVGSIHNVMFGPVATVDDVYSASLQRRVMSNSDSEMNWLRPTQYAITYDEQDPAIAVRYAGSYTISYSYWTVDDDGNRTLHTVNGVTFDAPGGEWVPVPLDNAGNPVASVKDFDGIDDRSDQLSRAFNRIDADEPWSPSDPYQYKVLHELLGRLAFNPLGYTYKERTPAGVVELTARINYTVYDWGIISETLTVPDSEPYTVRTTLRNIKQTGITLDDMGQPYGGIAPGTSAGNADLLILDDSTGTLLTGADATVDYRNGTITLAGDLAGRQVRVFYRAEGDWQVRVEKAFERYTQQDDRGVNYREFTHARGADKLHLYPLDAGKSFSVDYVWVDDSGVDHTVTGEVHRADDSLVQLGGNDAAVVYLERPAEYITAVRGVSLKVRVMWSEGSRQQTVDDGGGTRTLLVPRWQHYDLDAELSRTISAG